MNDFPKVSIVIPVLNESKTIDQALYAIVNSNYPINKIEIIISQGKSEDDTDNLIDKFINNNKDVIIKVINNHKNITPVGLNLCINEASGKFIIRLDGHTIINENYIHELVNYSLKNKVDNVGGVCETITFKNNLVAKSIIYSMSSIIGVGNSEFRLNRIQQPKEVDTVPFGCFNESLFKKIGLYDERLERNQDIELNKRIRRNGGKIVLLPNVKSKYIARDNYYDFAKNSFLNGFWNIKTAYLTNQVKSLSLRHYIPFVFVTTLIILSIMALFFNSLLLSPAPILLLYMSTLLIRLKIDKKKFRHFLHYIFSLMLLHISYGTGSLWGIIKIIFIKKNV